MKRPGVSRRGPAFRPSPEALEARVQLTGGGGALFAVDSGAIASKGGTVSIPFTIEPGHFTVPRGKLVLGLDVSSALSAVQPVIQNVLDPQGRSVHLTHGTYNAALSTQLKGITQTSAAVVTLNVSALRHQKSTTFNVIVGAQNSTQGALHLGFYLPGDSNGDGAVTTSDIQAIQTALGTSAGQTKYNENADANRDGTIDSKDLALARQDLGVKTTLLPELTGHPDPASAVDPKTLVTSVQNLGFTGVASPGATVTITPLNNNAGGAVVKATADATGNYKTTLHLAVGPNAYSFTAVDAFGQINSGVLPNLTYTPKT